MTEPITRAEAIRQGYLIDITDKASAIGINIPVAISRKANVESATFITDVLFAMQMSARRHIIGSDSMPFQVRVILPDDTGRQVQRMVPLKCVIGKCDDGSPCATIMMPDEI